MVSVAGKVSVKEVPVNGKRVFCRVDFNVPISKDGQTIGNNQRILAALPTIRWLQEGGARLIVLASHLGRPDGKRVPTLSLAPIAVELERLLGQPVIFLSDCVGPEVEAACAQAPHGSVILLENVRFHSEEEAEDDSLPAVKAFRASLSRLAPDLFVQEAFGAVHRAHSSIVGVEAPQRVMGLLVSRELGYFERVLGQPVALAILGGAKVSDKLPLIAHLLPRVKNLLIGGGMPFTFLHVLRGMPIGKSLYDEAGAAQVSQLMAEAERLGVTIHLPVDFVCGDAFSPQAQTRVCTVEEGGIPEGWLGLDVGPATRAANQTLLESLSPGDTVLWNGPLGAFEMEPFAAGTKSLLANLVAVTQSHGVISIVGGGDSAAAVAKWHAEEQLSHVSTGGGASLELMEGKILPGIAILSEH